MTSTSYVRASSKRITDSHMQRTSLPSTAGMLRRFGTAIAHVHSVRVRVINHHPSLHSYCKPILRSLAPPISYPLLTTTTTTTPSRNIITSSTPSTMPPSTSTPSTKRQRLDQDGSTPSAVPTITIHHPDTQIPITIPTHLFTTASPEQHRSHPLLSHKPFQSWLHTLTHSLSLQSTSPDHPFHSDPYTLKSIKVNHINYFGHGEKSRIGFVSMDAEISNTAGETLPGVVFLRGGAVAILLIVEEEKEYDPRGGGQNEPREAWTILTVQPRIATGALRFAEIPAGMIDDAGQVTGKAAEEIKEELGIEIDAGKLIDLYALERQLPGLEEEEEEDNDNDDDDDDSCEEADPDAEKEEKEKLQDGMYPSAGGSDEFIKLYAYIHQIPQGGIADFEGRVGGNRDEGERIVLKVVRLEDMWRVARRDAKALSAWALWKELEEAGMV